MGRCVRDSFALALALALAGPKNTTGWEPSRGRGRSGNAFGARSKDTLRYGEIRQIVETLPCSQNSAGTG